jgi:hypothetical protein
MQLISSLSSIAIVVALASCTTPTMVTSTWKDPSYAAAPMRKVLVHGARMTDTGRHEVENRFAAALAQHGVTGVQAYRIYPGRVPDREEVRRDLEANGYDGVLVVDLRDVEMTYTMSEDFYSYYGNWEKGSVETDHNVWVETSLWDARTGKLAWSATSRTENPTSSSDAAQSLVDKIVASMIDARMISNKPSVARAVFFGGAW